MVKNLSVNFSDDKKTSSDGFELLQNLQITKYGIHTGRTFLCKAQLHNDKIKAEIAKDKINFDNNQIGVH